MSTLASASAALARSSEGGISVYAFAEIVEKMSDLKPQESLLVGRWIPSAGRVEGDETCKRIERLTDGELEFVEAIQMVPDGLGSLETRRTRPIGNSPIRKARCTVAARQLFE